MTANEILSIARKELGVKESPSGSNRCKYCAEYGVVTAWCVIFVWWCFRKAGAAKLFYDGGKCASCSQLMLWAKHKGLWVTKNYRPGDLCIYDFEKNGRVDHIGIVESVSGSTVTAIEGNTAAGNDANGGQVQRRVRNVSLVVGAVRPKYQTTSSKTEAVKVEISKLPLLKQGSKGGTVKALQILLKGYGYKGSDGKVLTIDSDFGKNTEYALKAYQKKSGLAVDGQCGQKTWAKMMGV